MLDAIRLQRPPSKQADEPNLRRFSAQARDPSSSWLSRASDQLPVTLKRLPMLSQPIT